MSMSSLNRPALGQPAALGTLYDARNDKFLHHSLLSGTPPAESINCTPVDTANITIANSGTYKDRINTMGVYPELSASFLAGLLEVEGSGRYLTNSEHNTALTVHRALGYTITSIRESFLAGSFQEFFKFDELENGLAATHVVVEVTWGACCVVAATVTLPCEEDRRESERRLELDLQNFQQADPFADPQCSAPQFSGTVMVHSDFLDHEDDPANDLEIAYAHLRILPTLLKENSGGKGKPLSYTLLPLSLFLPRADIPLVVTIGELGTELHEKFAGLLDDIHGARGLLHDYYQQLKRYRFAADAEHLTDVADRIHDVRKAESDLKTRFAKTLKAVRAGRSSAGEVSRLIEGFMQGDSAPQRIRAMTEECSEKIKFVASMKQKGAKYVGYNGISLDEVLRQDPGDETYVLYFNGEVMRKKTLAWKGNIDILESILGDQKRKATVHTAVVDCDAGDTPLDEPYVSHFQGLTLATKDILGHRKDLASASTIRYDEKFLDTRAADVPSERKPVKISCPLGCNGYICEWVCFKCRITVEYAPSDDLIYCDCGRVPFDRVSFNCAKPRHGPTYARYKTTTLRNKLAKLPDPPEINILILGESGVGKSTFINAFVNYLTFSSLDEALSVPRLNWIIPCSFATQRVEENTGEFIEEKVEIGHGKGKIGYDKSKIGHDKDEVDGVSGQSATQQATAYPLYIDGKLIRLIDTPGIGDVRGVEQDKKNMQNVLSVLRSYDKVHGILILLKPNNARLGIMFKFCVKELLTHLHRDAVGNMVYGFTNTRASNYRPGDTYGPLVTLLKEYKNVIPNLINNTVYCFDSESFRYLAARKKNIEMGNIEDYRRSWQHSVTETRRLIGYFEGRSPHLVKSTISLNETRFLITQLTGPMAKISAAMLESMEQSETQIKDLSDTKLTGEALKAKLQVQKTVVHIERFDRPRTVCNHYSCVTQGEDPANNQKIVLRKYRCHDPCCLTNVVAEVIGHQNIAQCAAFSASVCTVCGHRPKDHLHTMVEYSERTETSTDRAVQNALTTTGQVINAKQAHIKVLEQQIAEFRSEHIMMQEAAARFSFYLQQHCITGYMGNDATLEYLQHMIDDEKSKANFGGSTTRLKALEEDKRKYKEFVQTMKEGNRREVRYQALDAEGVYREIEKLYAMKHYGKMLRDIAHVVGKAYAATFREKPYRIRGKSFWMSDGPTPTRRGLRGSMAGPSSHFSMPTALRGPTATSQHVKSLIPGRRSGQVDSKHSRSKSAPVANPLLDDSPPPPPPYNEAGEGPSNWSSTNLHDEPRWSDVPVTAGQQVGNQHHSKPSRIKSFVRRAMGKLGSGL